jgi:hypothetical protein
MSAAARTAAVGTTTMGSAATMELASTATVELIPAAESTAMEITIAAESVAAAESSAMEVTPTMKIALATEIAEPVTTAESVIVAAEITITGPVAAVETVEPRTHSDKNAAIEVFGTVITVRRASVWVVSVVAVSAVGRRTEVSWRRSIARTNSNAYANSNLGIGSRARENYEKPEQTEIFKISHRQTSYMYTPLEAIAVPKAGEGVHVYVPEESLIYMRWFADSRRRTGLAWPKSTARAAFQPIHAGESVMQSRSSGLPLASPVR